MTQPAALARALLLVFLLLALLAAPVIFTLSLAQAVTPQQSEAAASPVSLVALTGSTPEYGGGGKLAAPQAAQLQQAATGIVISEFRSRGPAAPDYPTQDGDEFIELFNPTGAPFTIPNWSIWRSDCTGLTSRIDDISPLNITIPAGGHYLIGGLSYSGAVAPDDASNDIGLADDGGLALISGMAESDPKVDQVGMCSTGGFVEPTPLAPLSGDADQSYDRNAEIPGGICTDAGNNSTDFFLRTPGDPQSSTSSLTTCGNPTPTATPTNTPTHTPTATPTSVCTGLLPSPLLVLINEVAWYGTLANAQHYWVELYNTHASCRVSLDGWRLVGIRSGGQVFQVSFDSGDGIDPNDYLIVARDTDTFDPILPVDMKVAATLLLGSSGQSLQLLGPSASEVLVDTANYSPTGALAWPAGSTSNRRSMERYRPTADSRTNWVTFARPLPFPSNWPKAADGTNPIYGSPGMANWAFSVTVTPSPVPTKGRTPTPIRPTPFGRMVINEFLPRSATDWNSDGAIDVFDEFIEIKNLGPVNVELTNWKLDDVAGAGSAMYTLPARSLKPGERALYYGLATRILLEDSGDTVRLINPQGVVVDARSYGVVEEADESHCRIPDGYYWRLGCFATPGNENALTGVAPAPAPISVGRPPPCLLPDTVPEPFRQAECEAYGEDMYDRSYWDALAGFEVFPVPSRYTKWHTSVE